MAKKIREYTIIPVGESTFPQIKIINSEQAYQFIKEFYGTDITIYESAFMVLLNRSGKTLGFVKLSQGGTAGAIIDPKLIAFYAINHLTSSIILAHNHPSGSLTPSSQDKIITDQVRRGLKLFDIMLHDHIILTDREYFSFADEGLL